MRQSTLEHLLSPMDVAVFVQEYWDQKHLHLVRGEPTFYEHILTLDSLDEFLSRNDIRYPSLRMMRAGKAIPLSDFSRPLKFGNYAADGLIDVDRVYEHYKNGASVILQMMRSSISSVSNFANRLQKDLRFNVESTIYVTPPSEQGFTTHFDTHSVIVLQVAGRKRWRLYDFPIQYPLLSDKFDMFEYSPPEPTFDITLEPGDLLYVPRGMAHDATSTQDSKSVHITVGLFPPLWTDLFETRLRQLKNDVRFRRSPVTFFLQEKADEFAVNCEQMSQEAFAGVDLDDLLTATLRQHVPRQSRMAVGSLTGAAENIPLSPSTVLRARQNVVWQIERNANNVAVYFYSRRLVVPISVGQAVDNLLSGAIFAIKDLQSNLDPQSSVLLGRKFLDAGLVELVS